jgi:hypothetical protein
MIVEITGQDFDEAVLKSDYRCSPVSSFPSAGHALPLVWP